MVPSSGIPRPEQPHILAKIIEESGFHEATSSPANDHYRQVIYDWQHPMTEGPVFPTRGDLGGPAEAAEYVKAYARRLGAHEVGISPVLGEHVYTDREVTHPWAIVVGMAMDHAAVAAAPQPEAGIEITRIYMELGWVTVRLAQHLRDLGWDCTAHHPRGDHLCDCDLLYIPHAIEAGLGQLGRHGTMLTPRYGPRLRLGIVSTTLSLARDHPVDYGYDWWCQRCDACARACPSSAIGEAKAPDRGTVRWLVDTEACLPYFVKYDGCTICISKCVLNLPTPEQTQRRTAQIGVARSRFVGRWGDIGPGAAGSTRASSVDPSP